MREAIVAAATALWRQGGRDAVSLSAVARRTDFARGVVYAHFSSRQELLAAVEAAATPVPAQEGDNYDRLMQVQADALERISRQVIAVAPPARDGVEAALTRLETRLAVTEQSLAALQQKSGERLANLDVETGALAERLHGLRQRLEKFEARQTVALAELRLALHKLANPQSPPAEPVAALEQQPPPEVAGDSEPPPTRLADYLLSARRSALDAAARQAAEPARRRWSASRRRRWAILAVAAILVVWFDAYVFAHYQPARGAVPATAHALRARPEWSPRAQLVRGLRYLNGTGVTMDIAKARMFVERAALRGQPVAENLMGVFCQTGTGVAPDMAAAAGWYENAAAHGNLKAMTNLGKLYAGGWRERLDFAKAASWFAKAAAYGEVDAAFDLAILYERGAGVPRSLPEAFKWYAIAAARGDTHAASRAAILAAQLTAEERAAADAAVAAFRPQAGDAAANDTPALSG